jgi:hypothetical protein
MPYIVATAAGAASALALDALTPLDLNLAVFQVVLVWSATFWTSRRELIVVAIVCSIFVVLPFWLSPRIRPVTWMDETNVLLHLAVVWAITQVALRRKGADEARRKAAQALAEAQATVRVLSGLLPICAWCKKIRNDDGTWQQLEVYIRSHSQAEFTHGACEECSAHVLSEQQFTGSHSPRGD